MKTSHCSKTGNNTPTRVKPLLTKADHILHSYSLHTGACNVFSSGNRGRETGGVVAVGGKPSLSRENPYILDRYLRF